MIVLDLLACALLHVGSGDDAEVDFRRHAVPGLVALRVLHDKPRNVVAAFQCVRDDDLRRPARAVAGHQPANEAVAPLVAAHSLERRADIFHDTIDTEGFGYKPTEPQALGVRVVFRHEEAADILRAHCPHRERRGDAGIDAAGHAQHESALAKRAQLFAKRRDDPLRLGGRVDDERSGRERLGDLQGFGFH